MGQAGHLISVQKNKQGIRISCSFVRPSGGKERKSDQDQMAGITEADTQSQVLGHHTGLWGPQLRCKKVSHSQILPEG